LIYHVIQTALWSEFEERAFKVDQQFLVSSTLPNVLFFINICYSFAPITDGKDTL
jgi:hypothetical protein